MNILSLLGFSYILMIFALACLLVSVVANWEIFKKAGHPGWHVIVPVYSDYVKYQLYWGNGWLSFIELALDLLLAFVLKSGWLYWAAKLLSFCLSAATSYKKGEAFGQSRGYCIAMIFLEPFTSIPLAFWEYGDYMGVPRDGWSYDEIRAKLKK